MDTDAWDAIIANLWPYHLVAGHTNDPSKGACALAAISWLKYGTHSDQVPCVCPVLSEVLITTNDLMMDLQRQRLKPLLHRFAGSRSQRHQAARAHILTLGAIRVFAAGALQAHGHHSKAALLRDQPDKVQMEQLAQILWQLRVQFPSLDKVFLFSWAAANRLARTKFIPLGRSDLAYRLLGTTLNGPIDATLICGVLRTSALLPQLLAQQLWNGWLQVLDQALAAGPQGEPWSVDVLADGAAAFAQARGEGVAA